MHIRHVKLNSGPGARELPPCPAVALPVSRKYGKVASVKTTLELPDHLFRRAKAAAATRGMSLKEFVSDALGRRLLAEPGSFRPTWKRLHGGLASLRRETRRIRDLVDAEFERIDAEDSD